MDRQLDVRRAALDRDHRLRVHHLAYLEHALYRHRSARISGRIVRKSAGGGFSYWSVLVLRGRSDRRFLAFRIWHLVVLRQVGHCHRPKSPEAVAGIVPGILLGYDGRRAGESDSVPFTPATANRSGWSSRRRSRPRQNNLMATSPKIIVVGGGLAGLAAVIKIAEVGGQVDLFSIVPVKRSHSVCAQGGINAAKNLKGEGDSTWQHFDDTVYGGDFLAHQPPVKAMCDAAPGIIDLLDRMGVPFNRTPEGLLDFRRFGGTLYNRTAFAGATTGQQLLYALDEQVRRYESEGVVKKYEGWEFVGMAKDDTGRCIGSVAVDLRTMEIRA